MPCRNRSAAWRISSLRCSRKIRLIRLYTSSTSASIARYASGGTIAPWASRCQMAYSGGGWARMPSTITSSANEALLPPAGAKEAACSLRSHTATIIDAPQQSAAALGGHRTTHGGVASYVRELRASSIRLHAGPRRRPCDPHDLGDCSGGRHSPGGRSHGAYARGGGGTGAPLSVPPNDALLPPTRGLGKRPARGARIPQLL